jgi:hypothetical protein
MNSLLALAGYLSEGDEGFNDSADKGARVYRITQGARESLPLV